MNGIEGIDELKDEDEWKPDNPSGEAILKAADLSEERIRERMADAEGGSPEWDGRAVETVNIADVSDEAGVKLQPDQPPLDVQAFLEAVEIEEDIFKVEIEKVSGEDPHLERIADVVHQVWANWMEYMFTKGWMLTDKGFKIRSDSVIRWRRQMITPYAELSENEKQSDRDIARRYLDVMADFFLEDSHV